MDDHSYVRGGQRANGNNEHYGDLPRNYDLGDYDHQQLDHLRQKKGTVHLILTLTILFYSILQIFYSILFYSILYFLFCIIFYLAVQFSIMLYSVFYSIMYSILSCSLFYSILFSILSILSCKLPNFVNIFLHR